MKKFLIIFLSLFIFSCDPMSNELLFKKYITNNNFKGSYGFILSRSARSGDYTIHISIKRVYLKRIFTKISLENLEKLTRSKYPEVSNYATILYFSVLDAIEHIESGKSDEEFKINKYDFIKEKN